MPKPPATARSHSAAQAVVLDTNVVLDCWLFEDAAARSLREAIEQQLLRWEACAAMLAELRDVLSRPFGTRWDARRERLLTEQPWRHVELVATPPPAPAGLQCLDPDDQMFVDLALHRGAKWLITRDRALLRLRRRAKPYGLAINLPEQWRDRPEPEGLGETGRTA